MVPGLPSVRILLRVRQFRHERIWSRRCKGMQIHPRIHIEEGTTASALPCHCRHCDGPAVRQGLHHPARCTARRRDRHRSRTNASAASPAFCPAPTARLCRTETGRDAEMRAVHEKRARVTPPCVTGLSQSGNCVTRRGNAHERYVIIGNSAAAVGCVEGIRQRGSQAGEITLVSNEPHHTYSRPLISYLLCGQDGPRAA